MVLKYFKYLHFWSYTLSTQHSAGAIPPSPFFLHRVPLTGKEAGRMVEGGAGRETPNK